MKLPHALAKMKETHADLCSFCESKCMWLHFSRYNAATKVKWQIQLRFVSR